MPFKYHRHSAGKTILISSTYTIPPTTLEATTIGARHQTCPVARFDSVVVLWGRSQRTSTPVRFLVGGFNPFEKY